MSDEPQSTKTHVNGIDETIETTIDHEITDPDALESEIESLHQQLAQKDAQIAEANDAFLRSRAEFANLKRRTEEEKESLRAFLLADLIERLLPVVDNFERALTAAAATADYDKLVGGVTSTHKQMLDVLEREGLTPIPAVGEAFDPNVHNAVLSEETDAYPENTVIDELQRGYTLGGRVLRPTLVRVATRG